MKKFYIKYVDQSGVYPAVTIHEVPEGVAKQDKERGFYVLFSNNASNQRLSSYINIHNDEQLVAAMKSGPSSHVDSLGNPLEAGDYVLTTLHKYADLKLCRVHSFTKERIRVVPLYSNSLNDFVTYIGTTLKSPSDIVRVDRTLIS